MKDSISITDILWRELKKHHAEYCKRLDHDPDETWEKYNLRLIHESQGVIDE